MPKLLIVDDEAWVREGIAQILRRSGLGAFDILLAASGREGLALAEMERPEIIISDVRMPQMNGLDMARALVEKLPESKFIFISAYSEIDYYRAAMKLRAVSFVEKPIVPEELLAEVARAVELYAAERRFSTAPLSDAEREEIAFLSLLHGAVDSLPDPLRERLRPGRPIAVFVVGRLQPLPPPAKILALRDALLRAMEPEKPLCLCGMDGRNCAALVACAPLTDARRQSLAQVMLAAFPGERPFVTWGEADRPDAVPRALESALAQQSHAFFHPQSHFYAPRDDGIIHSAPNICTPAFAAELARLIEQRQVDRTIRFLREGLQRLREPAECSPEHARMTVLRMLNAAAESFARVGLKGAAATGWAEVADLPSFAALLDFAERAVRAWFDAAQSLDESGRCVYQIKCEIERDYADPSFSVARLAERVHLSESYAGNLFKRRTGMTIGAYLNAVRMERAKELLNDPANKVAEVGQRVGIENTDYFARRFKQYTGKTPSEYRR